MTKANADVLNAVSVALTKEFRKRFLKDDFSTTKDAFEGRPKKMHGQLSRLLKADGSVNSQAVMRIARRAVFALRNIKGTRRLRFYPTKPAAAKANGENVTALPPAKIALHRNEIGILFHIRAYA